MSLAPEMAEFITNFFKGTKHRVELRALPSKARVFTRDLKAITKFINAHISKENIYFGCATREGHGGSKEHCREIPAFWVDLDFKNSSKETVLETLANFKLPPSVVVASGGGLHVYWLLKTPLSAKNPRLEPVLRGLAQTLGADLMAAEKARILRLPGTLNRKYDPPRKVEMAVSPTQWERRYFLEDFLPFADSRPAHAVSAPVSADGKIPEGQRNDRLTSLAGSMRRRHMSEAAIFSALAIENLERCEPPLPEKEVRAIAKSIGRKEPAPSITNERRAFAELLRFSDIKPKKLRWLCQWRIPLGKPTLIAGDPGLGKSLLAIDIAARVSKGSRFPDGAACEPGDVIILSAEDDAEDTIRPRLDAAGAEVSRVHLLKDVRVVTADGKSAEHTFNLEGDIPVLEDAVNRTGARVVVIDPISAYAGSVDTNANAEVRGLLAPLATLAARHEVAVIAITHLRKSGGAAIYRAMASLAFAAAARAVWGVVADPDKEARRLFLQVKQNLAPNTDGLAYEIGAPEGAAPRVVWESEPVKMKAEEVMSGLESREEHSRRKEAEEWLRCELSDGPVPVRDVKSHSGPEGQCWPTVQRAAKSIGVVKKKTGGRGKGWEWSLPKGDSSKMLTPDNLK
jgi:archaellum biogenesis ATPase FlaH